MADDWKAGDLALYVGPLAGAAYPRATMQVGHSRVKKGRVYRATDVVPHGTWTALVIRGHLTTHPTMGWSAHVFRRLNDDNGDADALQRILACRPIKAPEPHKINQD